MVCSSAILLIPLQKTLHCTFKCHLYCLQLQRNSTDLALISLTVCAKWAAPPSGISTHMTLKLYETFRENDIRTKVLHNTNDGDPQYVAVGKQSNLDIIVPAVNNETLHDS